RLADQAVAVRIVRVALLQAIDLLLLARRGGLVRDAAEEAERGGAEAAVRAEGAADGDRDAMARLPADAEQRLDRNLRQAVGVFRKGGVAIPLADDRQAPALDDFHLGRHAEGAHVPDAHAGELAIRPEPDAAVGRHEEPELEAVVRDQPD